MAKFNFEKYTKAYAVLSVQKTEIEENMKVLREKIHNAFLIESEDKIVTKSATLYETSGSTSESVDLKKLKTESPDLYELLKGKGFIKTTTKAGAFNIKVKPILVENKQDII